MLFNGIACLVLGPFVREFPLEAEADEAWADWWAGGSVAEVKVD